VDVPKLQKLVKDQGFLIDGGYGKIKGTTFRISNMGDETEATMTPAFRRDGQGDGLRKSSERILRAHRVAFQDGRQSVNWEFHLGDFPAFWSARLSDPAKCLKFKIRSRPAPPHAIFYDAFSPAKNPAMWTLPVFENLFPRCSTRASLRAADLFAQHDSRVTLLLAGFFVGVGHATG
jgi:hypothetical protein